MTGTKFIDHSSGQRQGTDVEVQIMEDLCHVVVSHKPNQDGYIRKCFSVNGKKRFEMYHRYKWEREVGPIPEGYEVDHICRNRRCCNINHLQLLTRSEHKAKTNRERYADRIAAVKAVIKTGDMTTRQMAETFKVSLGYINRYRRELNAIH